MTCWAKCKHCLHDGADHGPGPNGDRCTVCAEQGEACPAFDVNMGTVSEGINSGEVPAGSTPASVVDYVRKLYEWDRKEVKR